MCVGTDLNMNSENASSVDGFHDLAIERNFHCAHTKEADYPTRTQGIYL